jgi:HEAT repeat protein
MPQPRLTAPPAPCSLGWLRASLMTALLAFLPAFLPSSQAAPFPPDPVDAFQILLRTRGSKLHKPPPPRESDTDEERAARKAQEKEFEAALDTRMTELRAAARDLKSVDQLTRALTLKEWEGDRVSDKVVLEREREIKPELTERLKTSIGKILTTREPVARVASLVYLSETAGEARRSVPPNRALIQLCQQFGPQVIRATRDANSDVAQTAIRTLGQIQANPAETLPVLENFLRSPDPSLRQASAESLLGGAQVITTALRESTTDDLLANRAEFRNAGRLYALAASQGSRDPVPAVRGRVLEALSVLASALKDDAKILGATGQQAYGPFLADFQKIVTQLPPLDSQRDTEGRLHLLGIIKDVDQARVSLAGIKQPDLIPGAPVNPIPGVPGPRGPLPLPPAELPSLVPADSIRRPQSSQKRSSATIQQVFWQVPEALKPLTPAQLRPTLDTLVAGLKDKDEEARLVSIDALAALGDQALPVLGNLLEATNDSNRFVRWAALRTLGRLQPNEPERVVPVLAEHLLEADLDVRKVAALAIARYGPKATAAVTPLARSIVRGDAEYRLQAFRALEAIGTEASPALPAIASNVTNSDHDLRLGAVQLLGRFGPLAVGHVRVIETALSDPEPDIRKAASVALLRVKGL